MSIMNYSNRKQIIQEVVLENMNLYPENYTESLKDALETCKNLAKGLFEDRNEHEIKSDKELEITQEDYVRFAEWELCNFLDEREEMKFDTVQDLFEWTGQDLENDYDFNRDLKTDNIFHPSFELTHEDDSIGFQFTIIKDKEFNSIIEFVECTSA